MSWSVDSNKPNQVLKQQAYLSVDHSFLTITMHLTHFEKNILQLISLRDKATSRKEQTAQEYLPGCVKH